MNSYTAIKQAEDKANQTRQPVIVTFGKQPQVGQKPKPGQSFKIVYPTF